MFNYLFVLFQKIFLSNGLLNGIFIGASVRLLIGILRLLWLAKRRLRIHWKKARLNNRPCPLVHLKARDEWHHRVIGANEKVLEVVVVAIIMIREESSLVLDER